MRKRLVLLIAALLSVPASSLAQTPSFGVKGGLNMATFTGSRIVASDARTGFTVGVFTSIPVLSGVSIQPEVSYARKGARSASYDYDAFPLDGDAPPIGVYLSEKTTHSYLEIPVLMKLSPTGRDALARPVFFAGPSVSFLLGAEEVYGVDYEKYMNTTDFGVILGGGVEIGRLAIDARYNWGLSKIDKDFDASFGNVTGGVKNRAFTVTAGLRVF